MLPYDEVKATIRIELRENGSVMVTGAIQNKEFAQKLLDAAYDAVRRYHEKQSPIIIPNAL
jgi:hypothetical protein